MFLVACVLTFPQIPKILHKIKQKSTEGLGSPRTGPHSENKVNEHLKNTESNILIAADQVFIVTLTYLMKGIAF